MTEQEMKNKKIDILKYKKIRAKSDVVWLKMTSSVHFLSKEEQAYFIKITEGVFGYNENIRSECLKMLSTDYHISLIEPFLCIFIKETIYQNIVMADLTLLIYAVRMSKSLVSNNNLILKPYIHEILPPILSCVLAKKISKYYYDNHWTLRDFSAYVVSSICKKFTNDLNNIKERVIDIYINGIEDSAKNLTTTYGAIKGLSSLGQDVIIAYLIPNIKHISSKVQKTLAAKCNIFHIEYQKQQMNEIKHIRNLIVRTCSPVLYQLKNENDGEFTYMQEFGCLGKALYLQVKHILDTQNRKTVQNRSFDFS